MRRVYQAMWLAATVLVFVAVASAQSGSRTGGMGKATTTTTPPGSGDQLPHTIFVRGKVAMADGSALPGPAAIVSVCGSNTRKETITRADGSFSFMLGDRNSSVMQDASNSDRPVDVFNGTNTSMTSNYPGAAPTQFDTRTLANCELKADLHGYESSHVEFTGMPTGTIDVGVLVIRNGGMKHDAPVVSVTSLQAPPNAKKELEKGRALAEKGQLAEAEASLRKAVEEYPQYAEAWYALGNLQTAKKDAGALSSYQAAQKADPSYVAPYPPLVRSAALAHEWPETVSLSDKLIALDASRYPMAYYYNAVANYNLDHLQVAEQSALKAESLDKTHGEPRVEILLGLIYTAKQDYSAAAQHYQAYLQIVPDGPLTAQVKSDLAKCEDMAKVSGATDGQPKP